MTAILTTEPALAAMAILTLKHLVADFLLQTGYIAANKGRYGHYSGVLHALGHVLLTPLVFLVLPAPSLAIAAALLGGEFVWHYHQDLLKDMVTRAYALTPNDTGFWWGLGIDQCVHQLTYIGMVYVLLHKPWL